MNDAVVVPLSSVQSYAPSYGSSHEAAQVRIELDLCWTPVTLLPLRTGGEELPTFPLLEAAPNFPLVIV